MDFTLSPRAERMRAEMAEFLAAHLPPELEEQMYATGVMHDDAFVRALAERDWIVPGRDPDGPGAELDADAIHVLTDALTKADAPFYAISTTVMVAKVIEHVGSDFLKETIVPPAMRGEITIALGMSEPEAGSDVAAVQTRARRDGDDWIIDGQKMFTTNGHITDYVFLLARTNPDVANHKGLTTFLVPLDSPGFEAQAVYTLSGERTNITFYSDLRLDDRWRIGDVDGGWGALMISLQDEHSFGFSPNLGRQLDAVEAWAAEPDPITGRRPIDDDDVRYGLTVAAAELEVANLLEQRVTWMESIGQVPVAEGPMAKLYGTEAIVRHAEALTELVGPDALRSRLDPTALQAGRIEHGLRFSLGTTIYAGTSEVQRNIIAQRACGLPR
jgi:alkylation response protein AidB-like acyl-CoA dehydrogenase